jgi:hypothetical protein
MTDEQLRDSFGRAFGGRPELIVRLRTAPVHRRAGGVSLVLDCSGDRLPRVLYWGADLGEVSDEELADLAVASVRQLVTTATVSRDPAGHRCRGGPPGSS